MDKLAHGDVLTQQTIAHVYFQLNYAYFYLIDNGADDHGNPQTI